MLISKQPVLTHDEQIEAFIFYYAPYEYVHPLRYTESFIQTLFNTGLTKLTEGKAGIFSIDKKLLLEDAVTTYPAEHFIFGIKDTQVDAELLERIDQLKAEHFRFAFFQTKPESIETELLETVLPRMEYYVIDASQVKPQQIVPVIKTLQQYPCMLIGSNVHDQQLKSDFQALGITHFAGSFFTQSSNEEQSEIETGYLDLLNLLNILEQSDSVDEIARNFAQHPDITYQLLQFLNSATFGLTRSVKSIRHALLLIGRKELRQWLLIMAFNQASKENGTESPLLHTAQTRVSMVTHLVEKIKELPASIKNEASFVAVLSLLQPLVGVSFQTLFKTITVDEKIEKAVTSYEGVLGKLLELCISAERFDKAKANMLLSSLQLTQKDFEEVTLHGYQR